MKQFVAIVVLGLVGCGGHNAPAPQTLTPQDVRKECVTWCYHRMQCYQDVCQQDYPGSASSVAVSVLANDCVHENCDTDGYLNAKLHQADYVACTNERTCREITTGTCGDVATCTADPSSTPYLPGTHTKAAPKAATPG